MKNKQKNASVRSATLAALLIIAIAVFSLVWASATQRRLGELIALTENVLDKIDLVASDGEIPSAPHDEILQSANELRDKWDSLKPLASLGVPHSYIRDVDSSIAQLEGSLDGYDSSQIGAGAHMALVALRQVKRIADIDCETIF